VDGAITCLTDTPRHQGANYGSEGVGDLVRDGSVRLLSSTVPHLSDENEAGQYCCLEGPEQKSTDNQTGEVVSGSSSDSDNRPRDKVEHDPIFHWQDNKSV